MKNISLFDIASEIENCISLDELYNKIRNENDEFKLKVLDLLEGLYIENFVGDNKIIFYNNLIISLNLDESKLKALLSIKIEDIKDYQTSIASILDTQYKSIIINSINDNNERAK